MNFYGMSIIRLNYLWPVKIIFYLYCILLYLYLSITLHLHTFSVLFYCLVLNKVKETKIASVKG